MAENIEELLAAAKKLNPSTEENEQQRRSFAYGNTNIENSQITRETVDKEAEALKRSWVLMNTESPRHSKPLEVELISDPAERARQEARNGLRQFDEVIEQTEYWLHPERPFRLRPSTVLTLHRKALEGISAFAGVWRPAGIAIVGSRHTPPEAYLVPELIEQMCEYVNDNWQKAPVHLSAFVMWRMNWIHPFVDGNGRTARALS
jgi:hypothetical protein